MTEDKPVVYVLHGDDREGIKTHLKKFYDSLGEPDMAEMNTTRLDGKTAKINDLRSAALALPFLTERRLVIVEDALQPYLGQGKEKEREAFLSFLESLPGSTALVLIVPDTKKYRRGSGKWEVLTEKHWLVQWSGTSENRAILVDCALPTDREMVKWIRQKAADMGGSLTSQAAQTLAEYLGNDTQRATQEIFKLLTYCNFVRPVEEDDVRRLTTRDHQTDIFKMVDAIGRRDGKQALEMLHLLLEESEPLQIFGMIIRQFRLLLQAREIIDGGGTEGDVVKRLGQHPYVAQKITSQSRQFDMPTLAAVYHRLLEIDLDMKTGRMPGDIALDVLIAQLAN